MQELEGRKRAIIEHVTPQINCGQFPVKRVIGEKIIVQADVFGDGHDEVRAYLRFRHIKNKDWQEVPMTFLINDRWEGAFIPDTFGKYEFTVHGWIDHFLTWQKGLKKKFEARQDLQVELLIGAQLIEEAAARTTGQQQEKLSQRADILRNSPNQAAAVTESLSEEVTRLMTEFGDKSESGSYKRILAVDVERKKALFSTWYELFPRSTSETPGKHGTFKDCERLIPEIVRMGFDVLYLPPVHPIGMAFRKGKNNNVTSQPGEPGSPWAIGASEGGHKSLNPELGTIDDFTSFVSKAKDAGLEVALDLALQCSQDHPYVKEHPQWFKWRPDGTVQYAENPPKKYQDVLPINFETTDWQNLWQELKSIVDYWISQGVNIFRVDNPHTKPFNFWEWLIKEVRNTNPDVIFLSEAFTRPRIMERLAKIGFTQSYTYYTWRNNAFEIKQYMTELTKTDMREYFRPNFWPNTPDILPVALQQGGEPAFITRLIMAATLSSNYGLYGPVYEFGINAPMAYGKEEYLDSEKYEIKHWNFQADTKIKDIMIRINKIRHENTALQTTWHIEFADTDNEHLLCYAKTDEEKTNFLLIVVNLDPYHMHSGFVKVPLYYLGIAPGSSYTVHDLLTGSRYRWQHEWNYVELHPTLIPAHVFRVEKV
jgi:starch synthase (maltosyl-transferring)